jgi:predicted CxxxxCH...CXXCH cytochrome family protein
MTGPTVINRFLLGALILAAVSGCAEKREPPTLPDAHPAAWLDESSVDFHGSVVQSRGTGSCAICHGADFRGGESGISCVDCHLQSGQACISCHGGTDNTSGAPPLGLRGEQGDTTLAVGAHSVHLVGAGMTDGVECESCHHVPPFALDSLHLDLGPGGVYAPDSIAEITWGGIAPAPGIDWNRGTARCSGSYCHGNFAGGDATNVPVWTSAGQAACGSCHNLGSDPATLGWKHEFHVTTGGLQCADCHINVVDTLLTVTSLTLHVNGVADTSTRDRALCGACHSGGTGACTYCHGGTDNNSGAPPDGLSGETATTQLAVGAHTAHLEASGQADAIACVTCHTVPDSLLAPSHLGADSIAEVTWGGIAPATGINWNRGSATCADTYCHGNFRGGDTTNTAVWTASGQAACGSCHDVGSDPASLERDHEYHVASIGLPCAECHLTVVDTLLNIVDSSLHVNGAPDTFIRDWGFCYTCHGDPPAACVACHGGTDNPTGAPPKGLLGQTATSSLAVGAHSAHVEDGPLADAFDCVECHLKPSSLLDAGHLGADSVAEIIWGGIAQAPGANWNRGSATCSDTYCHGNFGGGDGGNSPVWTGTNQATCGSCHDVGSSPGQLRGEHEKHVREE